METRDSAAPEDQITRRDALDKERLLKEAESLGPDCERHVRLMLETQGMGHAQKVLNSYKEKKK